MSDFLTGLLLGALPAFWQIRQLRAASALCSALQDRDALRICELADTDAALAESRERERRAKELVPALAERIYACHEILALRAERRAVAMTEVDYPTE